MAKGVKGLIAAAAQDKEQTAKAKTKQADDSITKTTESETKESPDSETSSPRKKSKNPGGRPTNKSKGIKSRQQYTLTLKEETYKLILAKAQEEEISFAKYMERAAIEYMKNNS